MGIDAGLQKLARRDHRGAILGVSGCKTVNTRKCHDLKKMEFDPGCVGIIVGVVGVENRCWSQSGEGCQTTGPMETKSGTQNYYNAD